MQITEVMRAIKEEKLAIENSLKAIKKSIHRGVYAKSINGTFTVYSFIDGKINRDKNIASKPIDFNISFNRRTGKCELGINDDVKLSTKTLSCVLDLMEKLELSSPLESLSDVDVDEIVISHSDEIDLSFDEDEDW